ncbi:hypothetical protein FSW04_12015 [Baekduia soli]|uniref:Uncharacterized protein n=1 Tax=Baekduia soli TaxID=496014 RepID=A0A5B8U523_9ACTN|nr:hypothetical protein [Baekduia soli]QEC48219.1 hypothetical protein FSW04_12015 [Baekduia soli]
MRVAGRDLPLAALQWLGLLAAPAAVLSQQIFGVALTLAQCNAAGRSWQLPVHALSAAATAVAAVVAALGVIAAVLALQATAGVEDQAAPPPGRVHFLAVVGLTVSPLLLAVILMDGFGVGFHEACRQS